MAALGHLATGRPEEQATARAVISDAETEQAIIEASITLGIEAKNAESRKALLVLALQGRSLRANCPIDVDSE